MKGTSKNAILQVLCPPETMTYREAPVVVNQSHSAMRDPLCQ
jgi:hypothetical protein